MQEEINKYYHKHLIDAKQAAEISLKMRDDYVISRVKKLDVNKIKRKILLNTSKGLSTLKILSIPTRYKKWYLKNESWQIPNRHVLAKILDEKGILNQLRQLLEIPELAILEVKHSRLAGHEYHVYDVVISWPCRISQCHIEERV